MPLSLTPDVMSVAGKGEIDSSIAVSEGCNGVPTTFTVTGASGAYAGASGSGTFKAGVLTDLDDPEIDEDDMSEWNQDTWTGTLTVPDLTFDLTPPVISGAGSKTVLAPAKAKLVRVVYTVTAQDNVDGTVPVICKPRPGSRFKIGRTKVICSATDSSANTATAKFAITVKHR